MRQFVFFNSLLGLRPTRARDENQLEGLRHLVTSQSTHYHEHFQDQPQVTRQRSSGDRNLLLGISKRSDRYLWTLLIRGARSALWRVERRRDRRSIWALLTRGDNYRPKVPADPGRGDSLRIPSAALDASLPVCNCPDNAPLLAQRQERR
jgi:hypothetical protein